MRRHRPELFKGRRFEAEIIVLCVRWYLRYPLSLRQLEEIMAEREPQLGSRHDLALGPSGTRWNSTVAVARNSGTPTVVAR